MLWSRKKEGREEGGSSFRSILDRAAKFYDIETLAFEFVALILRINYPLRRSVMREMRRDMRYSSWNVCMPRAYHWPSGMGVCSFRIRYSRMSASILLFRRLIRIIRTG